MDQYTETTTVSFGSRVMGSLGGVVVGFVFVLAAFPLLWWNEGRSLHHIRDLDAARHDVVQIAADHVDPANNGKLVFLTGMASTDDTLDDSLFGMRGIALRLDRQVEMYQWRESKQTGTTNNMGGSQTRQTTYSYAQVWSDRPINSSSFKVRAGHENPSMPYPSESLFADNVKVGVFTLARDFLRQIQPPIPYALTEQNVANMDESLKGKFVLDDKGQYVSGNPGSPAEGDLRISYSYVGPANVSLVGKQDNGRIEPYAENNGEIKLLQTGIVGVDQVFAKAEKSNMVTTWLIRFGGFFLIWIGMKMLTSPLIVLSGFVPALGAVADTGLGLIAFFFSVTFGSLVIALAWLAYRPLIGLGFVLVAGLCLFMGIKHMHKAKARIQANMKSGQVVASASVAPASIPEGMPGPSSN